MSNRHEVNGKGRSLGAAFGLAVNGIAMGLLAGLLLIGVGCRAFSRFGVVLLGLLLVHIAYCAIARTLTKGRHPPKAYRRCVSGLWILLGAILAVRLLWPDGDAWRPYTFEDEAAGAGAGQRIAGAENAASLYEALWRRLELETARLASRGAQYRFAADQPAHSSGDAEALALLDNWPGLIPALMDASSRDACRFPIPTHPSADADQEFARQHSMFVLCSYLLRVAAERDIENGRADAGIEKCRCVMEMAKHLFQQSTVTHFCAGVAVEGEAFDLVAELTMNDVLSDTNLEAISKCIELENNWDKDWARIVEVEKLRAKNLCGRLYEVNSQGQTRFTRKFFSIFARENAAGIVTAGWKAEMGNRLAPIGLALLIPSSPEKAGKIIDDICQKRYLSADRQSVFESPEEKQRSLAQMLRSLHGMRFLVHLPWLKSLELWGLDGLYARQVAKRRKCRILIGLRCFKNRHGHWPAKLEEIKSLVPAAAFVDPISGGDFRDQLILQRYLDFTSKHNLLLHKRL